MQKTYTAKPGEIERRWLLLDADGVSLGRLAARVASLLRGKHKAAFTPHVDTGDHVIIVNASKIVLTGNKATQKMHYTHSGHLGHLKERAYGELLAKRPEFVVRLAVKGMLPRNALGRSMMRKLKIYAGGEHPHATQKPERVEAVMRGRPAGEGEQS